MTIKQIDIKGFQSHSNSVLKLDDNVNVVVGSSDSGKSAVLRALNLIINNQPSGNSFISNWSKSVEVKLETKDFTVIRYKDKKDNYYKLDDEKYEAMGKGKVPEEISKLLNFTELNIQTQMEAPFLLSSSPGEVARYLNKIVHLDKIDTCLSNLESKKRGFKRELEYKTKEQEKLESDLEYYNRLDSFEKDIKRLEKLEANFRDKKKQYTDLYLLMSNIVEIEKSKIKHNNIIKLEKEIDSLLAIYKDIKEKKKQHDNLCLLTDSMIEINQEQVKHKKIVKLEKEVDSLIDKNNTVKELKNNKHELANVVQRIISHKEAIETQKEILKELEEEFHEIFPETCPLCGR
jgi:DNA repair exonuclease SbcCD ATPase subunit